MKIDDRLRAWAYLSRVFEGPSRALQGLLDSESGDVEKIAYGIRHQSEWLGPVIGETSSRYTWDCVDDDLSVIDSLGGRLITPDSSEWPSELFASAFGFAASGNSPHIRSYQSDAVAPHALWVIGENLSSVVAQSVAVVGTRAVSSYGTAVTRDIVGGLVSHQWSIVSGGALGVDTVAHAETLRSGGRTVVVAACGLDRNYPSRNKTLFRHISTSEGVLVSEYPQGIPPHRHRFLTRNRLVAALSSGVVVIEAGWRSGALNTLSWASGLGRVAMAVPGPVNNQGSVGCHERIRNNEAEMVCNADEVRSLVSALGSVDPSLDLEIRFSSGPLSALTRNEMRVYDGVGKTPTSTTDIAISAGLPMPLCMHILIHLEKAGLVVRIGSNWQIVELK